LLAQTARSLRCRIPSAISGTSDVLSAVAAGVPLREGDLAGPVAYSTDAEGNDASSVAPEKRSAAIELPNSEDKHRTKSAEYSLAIPSCSMMPRMTTKANAITVKYGNQMSR
jgi:hypothetical protein